MKVLHVNTYSSIGGAARAAHRIYWVQLEYGIDSRMRVLHRNEDDDRIKGGGRPPPRIIERQLRKLQDRWLAYSRRGWETNNPVLHTFGEESAGLVDELNACDSDILNLHWVAGMLSVGDIGRLGKPIVWTLHDMWAFCGAEHYAPDDAGARFRQGYRPDNRPSRESGPDLNRHTWEAKRRAWAKQRLTIVSPSRWLAYCARGSVLFAEADIHVIPNPMEMMYLWRPIQRDAARIALGLPLENKLILMGADGGVADPRKGGDLLHDAIARVAAKSPNKIELVIYGQSKPKNEASWPCPMHWLGVVRDDRILALAYSAADVMVVPSRQDNLPNTALEAQACGTPVVAFDVGGLPDIVSHRKTGWLAKPFDTEDLAEGISWVMTDGERWQSLKQKSRQQAVERFSPLTVAQSYACLYDSILKHPITRKSIKHNKINDSCD